MEHQWKELLESAGFEVRGVWNISLGKESVIEAVPGKEAAWNSRRDGHARQGMEACYMENRVLRMSSSPYAGILRR